MCRQLTQIIVAGALIGVLPALAMAQFPGAGYSWPGRPDFPSWTGGFQPFGPQQPSIPGLPPIPGLPRAFANIIQRHGGANLRPEIHKTIHAPDAYNTKQIIDKITGNPWQGMPNPDASRRSGVFNPMNLPGTQIPDRLPGTGNVSPLERQFPMVPPIAPDLAKAPLPRTELINLKLEESPQWQKHLCRWLPYSVILALIAGLRKRPAQCD